MAHSVSVFPLSSAGQGLLRTLASMPPFLNARAFLTQISQAILTENGDTLAHLIDARIDARGGVPSASQFRLSGDFADLADALVRASVASTKEEERTELENALSYCCPFHF